MKRNDLLAIVSGMAEDTEFFIEGQGIAEGFPLSGIFVQTCRDYYDYIEDEEDIERRLSDEGMKADDIILRVR